MMDYKVLTEIPGQMTAEQYLVWVSKCESYELRKQALVRDITVEEIDAVIDRVQAKLVPHGWDGDLVSSTVAAMIVNYSN
jgi:hypothetical protein